MDSPRILIATRLIRGGHLHSRCHATYTRKVRAPAPAGVICHLRPRHEANPLNSTMQPHCKIGDLAIVVTAELSQNLGQIVEVVGVCTGKSLTLKGTGPVWTVRTIGGRQTL